MSLNKFFLTLLMMGWLFPLIAEGAPEKSPLNFMGKVIHVVGEKTFYGIESETGGKYVPVNLPELFKQEDLLVQVKAEKAKGEPIGEWKDYIYLKSILMDACTTPEISIEELSIPD